MLANTAPSFKSPTKSSIQESKDWSGKISTPKSAPFSAQMSETKTQTMQPNEQPVSTPNETIKRHIHSMESLKKRSKKVSRKCLKVANYTEN